MFSFEQPDKPVPGLLNELDRTFLERSKKCFVHEDYFLPNESSDGSTLVALRLACRDIPYNLLLAWEHGVIAWNTRAPGRQ